MLITFIKFNINNFKEKRGFDSKRLSMNNINKDSLIKDKINLSNSAGSIINKNLPSNKFLNDDFHIKDDPTQREKRKRNKFSSIFSDFFSSNNYKKNSSLNYNSFQDSNSLNLEMSNNSNNQSNNVDLNKKTNAGFYNKKFKNDEKNFSLIVENPINNNAQNKPIEGNLNNKRYLSENEKSLSKEKLSPKDKLEQHYTNSFSSTSENYKIDKQNYILESEINLSKPIAIKNILNAANNKNENENENKNKEKNKFSRYKIKDFIKEKILKNSNTDSNLKNNNYKNLYENLKFNYSDLENETIKNENIANVNKNKFSSNDKQSKNAINNIESEVDYETDPEDLRKIDEVVKREVKLHSPKNKDKSSVSIQRTYENENSPDIKIKVSVSISNLNNPSSLNDINFNKINQNKKYNNLVEEQLDDEASSNIEEENIGDANNNSSINKQSSFISVKLNDDKINENEDSIIKKINKFENTNLENINYNKRKSFEFITKNSSKNDYNNNNIKKNLLEVFENKENSENKTSQFPKFEEIFGEKIETQTQKLKKTSLFGNFETFTLFKVIVKNGEDLRQEQFATQLINEFHQIFKMEKVDCWVNTYEILATGYNAGIIEVVPNSISLDQLKRKAKGITSLRHFFEVYYGPENEKRFKNAMKNFISSLAGYSLVCYFLQIKDRHNANILIDDAGHLIHIDFGFMFTNAPGKGIKFEKAPFKLTKEFVDAMGGVNSKTFQKFRKLLWK